MPCSGRPRATTVVDDRYLRISAQRNPDSNATMLNNAFRAATGWRITTQTVRNRLHDAQLHSQRPWRGPSLQPRHHAARYRWTQKHAEWAPRNWHHVLFTWVSHMPPTRQSSASCLEATWSGWTSSKQCPASAARWWFSDVLGWHYVGPTYATGGHRMRRNGFTIHEWHPPTYSGEAFVFMDDNYFVNDFLQDNDIARLEWPACSSDMNPIEHAWDRLKRAVYGRLDPPTTLRGIRQITIEECDNLTVPWWWIVCHDGYRHASMQEDVLLGIRGTGVYCNLDHNFWKSIWMMVRHAICGFMSNKKSWNVFLCGSLFHLYVKVLELVEPRWYKTFFYVCIKSYSSQKLTLCCLCFKWLSLSRIITFFKWAFKF